LGAESPEPEQREKVMRPWRDSIVIVLFLCPVLGVGIEGEVQTAANDAAKSSATAASADQRARFTGTYRYSGSAQEEEARSKTIDHAVEGLSFYYCMYLDLAI
jgi:hypothetical protein